MSSTEKNNLEKKLTFVEWDFLNNDLNKGE